MWTHLERQKGGIGMRGPGKRKSKPTEGLSATELLY
jgi:50S ribosomal subunit-associated GTPase HflX